MAPAEFSLRLQRGITGGFAPPTPSAVHTVTASQNKPSLFITSAIREDGTPNFSEGVPKSLAFPHSESDHPHTALVSELHTILKSIPTEQPAGSEDIYGLDTSIAFGSDDLEWMNGGPQGCGGGSSTVQPSSEDKKKFARAVEIVEELVGKAE